MEITGATQTNKINIQQVCLYLFIILVVIGLGVYVYLRHLTTNFKKEVQDLQNVPIEELNDELSDKILEIQKYLFHHPTE